MWWNRDEQLNCLHLAVMRMLANANIHQDHLLNSTQIHPVKIMGAVYAVDAEGSEAI